MNRLQDSFFYQQFSYEVQLKNTNEYLNELKGSIHLVLVFGKVKISSPIEEPMTLSTLTDAISISAFSAADFLRFVRRSLDLELHDIQDEVIVKEDSVSVSDIDEFFLLEDGGLLLQETVTYDGATVISNNLVLDGTQDG